MTVTTSSSGSTAACAIGYRVTGAWSGGFQGEVVIRNTGTSAVDGWTLRWIFPDSQRVSSLWGGTVAQSGAAVTVTAASYTANIPAAGSVTLGFTATRGSTNPAPTAFTLNGAACTAT
ncbi:cellulose binding domain-containing protein [Streptomyces europaeiscabiei]|uniref:cellulose binding domain-containing protein n=1 Tax=Streptomyces europaeiscabiei TaxID=146819 RepID=UPI00399067D4